MLMEKEVLEKEGRRFCFWEVMVLIRLRVPNMLDAVTPGTFYKECGNIMEAVEKGKSGRRFSEVVTQKIKLG